MNRRTGGYGFPRSRERREILFGLLAELRVRTAEGPSDGDGFREALNSSYDLLPDGQISSPCGLRLSSPICKNISVFPKPKSEPYD
jgi:hypothetical protein